MYSHLLTKEAARFQVYHHKCWSHWVADCLNLLHQYCSCFASGVVPDVYTVLTDLGHTEMRAFIAQLRVVEDLWLEPHDLALVNDLYINRIKSKWGDEAIAANKVLTFEWKNLEEDGHRTERHHGKDLEVRLLLLQGKILPDMQVAFKAFADELMMVAESFFRPHKTKGRYYGFFAELEKHFFTMDKGAKVTKAMLATRKQADFLNIWREIIVDPYNESLEEVRRDMASQNPSCNVRFLPWEINLV